MSRSPDVIVVGGGAFGCAVAYEIAGRAADVLLIDTDLPGRATSASAGGLWPVGEAVGLGCGVIYHSVDGAEAGGPEPLPDIFRDFLVESNACFPKLAEQLLELTGIDIELDRGPGLLFAMFDESELSMIDRVAKSLPPDIPIEHLSAEEAAQLEPELSPDLIGGVLLPGEHQVNPMYLAEAYKRAALRLGATFRHGTRVRSIRRRGARVVGVETEDAVLSAGCVVNAAGAWSAQLAATTGIRLPVSPVRGQIVLSEALPRLLGACLSTSLCYLAQKAHGELLIGSTTEQSGFDVSVTEDAIRSLCRGAIRIMPALCEVRVKRVWAGLRPGTPDELPILGPVEGLAGYANATGGFRTGIVASPLAGKLIAQSTLGEAPVFPLGAFLASRFEDPRGA